MTTWFPNNLIESAGQSFLYSFAVGTILSVGGPATVVTALSAGATAGCIGAVATLIHALTTPLFKALLAKDDGKLDKTQELLRRQLVIITLAVITSFNEAFWIRLFATSFFDLAYNAINYIKFEKEQPNIKNGAIFVPLTFQSIL